MTAKKRTRVVIVNRRTSGACPANDPAEEFQAVQRPQPVSTKPPMDFGEYARRFFAILNGEKQ